MRNRADEKINIVGAGLAGLSAALTLAKRGIPLRLISAQVSERAQSNLAEGGVNAVLNTMGEDDTFDEHFADTMRGGCDLADPKMVRGLVEHAPEIIDELLRFGVPFHFEDGHIAERNFGGQKKKRTAFVKSSTGKMLTVAMVDAVRRYEAEGFVERFSHHIFEQVVFEDELTSEPKIAGIKVRDTFTNTTTIFRGATILCTGGLNGFFDGLTTGTTANTGTAAAILFSQGVRFGNLEMIQYHPTTVQIAGKRMLISEAARGEGGRLFYDRKNGEKRERVYFMEEKYGAGGNLMPRDVVSREMAFVTANGDAPIFLDMTEISTAIWESRLSDLRSEILDYLGIDAKEEPVPVSPGIHYFMGGILVDEKHRTNIGGLYAAGECACAYHGANRLGGNSLLGAIYGGRVAAEAAASECCGADETEMSELQCSLVSTTVDDKKSDAGVLNKTAAGIRTNESDDMTEDKMQTALRDGMSILRDGDTIRASLEDMRALQKRAIEINAPAGKKARLRLAEAMLKSAAARKESRGAHTRTDFPKTDAAFQKTTVAHFDGNETHIAFAAREDGAQ